MPGILRSKERVDGTKHYYYRYPTTNLLKGRFCPLCLNEIPQGGHEIHHIVPASETLYDIGKVVNYHRNLIHLCAVCHKKLTHGSDKEKLLLSRRTEFYMQGIYGLFYYSNRNLLKAFIDKYQKIDSRFPPEEKPKDFLDYIRKINSLFKKAGIAHYRASFEFHEDAIREECFYFLNAIEISLFAQTPHYVFENSLISKAL